LSAPARSSSSAHAELPTLAAWCSGVTPCSSRCCAARGSPSSSRRASASPTAAATNALDLASAPSGSSSRATIELGAHCHGSRPSRARAEKYNSNMGWVSDRSAYPDSCLAAQAFSHFTCHHSGANLMIVDLQGVGPSLTDPAMHSSFVTDPQLPTDLGEEAMKMFFSSHVCNHLCKKLNLAPRPCQPGEAR
jgi:hypothetical protein